MLGNLLRSSAGLCSGSCKLELEHSVSLHLRAYHVGGEYENDKTRELAAQGLMRALSRYYALHSKLIKREDNLDWIQDTPDLNSTILAKQADARFAAGEQLVKTMQQLFEPESAISDTLAARVDPLLSRMSKPNIGVMDRARSGAAAAIAQQVLEVILKDAAKFDVPKPKEDKKEEEE